MISKQVREKVLAVAKRLASQAISYAANIPGNLTPKQREDRAVMFLQERAEHEIEARDQLVPVIGAYLDLPAVNALQRTAERVVIRLLIRQVYAAEQLQALK